MALDLATLGRSPYDTLLRTGSDRPFNIALLPPVRREQFHCGTVFTYVPQRNGTSGIRTFEVQDGPVSPTFTS